jgi:hypothetical protein
VSSYISDMMRKIVGCLIFMGFVVFMNSCQTGNYCPNCVNPKPAYYNAAKIKEARRMMRQSHVTTATGQVPGNDPAAEEKKKGSRSKHQKNQNPIVNEPIL